MLDHRVVVLALSAMAVAACEPWPEAAPPATVVAAPAAPTVVQNFSYVTNIFVTPQSTTVISSPPSSDTTVRTVHPSVLGNSDFTACDAYLAKVGRCLTVVAGSGAIRGKYEERLADIARAMKAADAAQRESFAQACRASLTAYDAAPCQ